MNKANKKITCPRCYSHKLYKFGKDKEGNQKYQCKECKRQFAPSATPKERQLKDYPRCPVCNKGTFIHHNYSNYINYRCNDKKCNHSFFVAKPTAIDPSSNTTIQGKLNFKGMRFPIHIILMALDLYFLNESSTRRISQYLFRTFNVKVSHVTIASWTKKFAAYFKLKSDNLFYNIDLSDSDEWHADETVVFINGKKHYLWLVIDSESRLIISYHLSPYRDAKQAFSLFNDAKKLGSPRAIVTDRLPSYNIPIKSVFQDTLHIKVQSFKDDISNNIIESFNKTFKSWYKGLKGFNSFDSANKLISVFIFHYNFIRNHSSLRSLTPAEVSGINYSVKAKNNWLLTA
ncbi:ISCb1g3, transposase [Clostridium botulinum BKT015925]|uniref:IS6 family transposase n=1 Tax=Clostridium botulinum TaxID=1491 RepID=UPI000207524F|nr:IS6 family transposase [Clostridium botulinum]AEB74793.1 ISCb1g3, transposase [Clostridium botulinum BKT015925]AEB74856.1 ISCb1g3, transposase [Clostridium botulinum BKT015925]AEB76098.1 ISCb1g3, transposase [Clostridium botulinum BKT015925]